MRYCKGQCCGKTKGCQCQEYCGKVCGAIRPGEPKCPPQAVIPSLTVESVSNLKDLADCFVHVSDINTTFYIDDKHRIMTTWAGLVSVEDYDFTANPLNLRGQIAYDAKNNTAAIYDKQGANYIFQISDINNDYMLLENKPQINGVTLEGNKTSADLGIPDIDEVALVFDTVADMKASTNLVNGSYARTLGFYSVNDGGGALYKITNSGTANELDVIAVGDLYASVILEKSMNLTQLGVNHTAADTTDAINNAISVCSQNKIHLIIPAHTYNITSITSEDVSGYHYKYFLKSLSNIYITGENRDNSIIKVNTNENYTGVFFNEEEAKNIVLNNFTIEQYYTSGNNMDGGDRSNRKIAFVLYGESDNIQIKNIYFKNCCGVDVVGFFDETNISNVTLESNRFDYKMVQGVSYYDRSVIYMECNNYIVKDNKINGNYEVLGGIECHGYNGICENNTVNNCEQGIHIAPRYPSTINSANIHATGNILNNNCRGIKIWENTAGANTIGCSGITIDSNIIYIDGSLYAQQFFFSGGLGTTNELNGIVANYASSHRIFRDILISNNSVVLKNYSTYVSYTSTGINYCAGISLAGQNDVDGANIINNYIEGFAGQGISIGEARSSATDYHTIMNVNIIGNTIKNCGYGQQNVNEYKAFILIRYGIMDNVILRNNILSKTDNSYNTYGAIFNQGNADSTKTNVYCDHNILHSVVNDANEFGIRNYAGYYTLITDRGDTTNRPTTANKGDEYYDTTLNKMLVFNGTNWINVNGTAL